MKAYLIMMTIRNYYYDKRLYKIAHILIRYIQREFAIKQEFIEHVNYHKGKRTDKLFKFPELKETTFLVAVDGIKADNNQLISDASKQKRR